MSRLIIFLTIGFFGLTGCQEATGPEGEARFLAMGDSMMAWNSLSGQAIPDVMEQHFREPVIDVAVRGARMLGGPGGFHIVKQFKAGSWDWVVINGGANDMIFGCNCGECTNIMNNIVSDDGGEGAFPDFVRSIRQTDARVVIVGYHRARGLDSPLKHCGDNLDEMERRLTEFSKTDIGVFFADISTLFPAKDASFYANDRVHPSPKGSKAIGDHLIKVIEKAK